MSLPIKIQLPQHFLEEEIRCDYFISEKAKKIWAVELDLYVELKRVCDKYHLKLLSDGGTTLGAVRHNGFIPWDDDMDFMMPRKDYNELCKHSGEFKQPYFLQTEYSDFGSLRGHAQLRNSLTTAILKCEYDERKARPFNQGIFVDIFPYDGCPELKEEQDLFLNLCRKKYYGVCHEYGLRYIDSKNQVKNIAKFLLKPLFCILISQNKIDKEYLEFEKLLQTYDMSRTTFCRNAIDVKVSLDNTRIYPSKLFFGCKEVKFEFLSMMIPNGAMEYLDISYGNWKKFVKGTSMHGNTIFDPEMSYAVFLRENTK